MCVQRLRLRRQLNKGIKREARIYCAMPAPIITRTARAAITPAAPATGNRCLPNRAAAQPGWLDAGSAAPGNRMAKSPSGAKIVREHETYGVGKSRMLG